MVSQQTLTVLIGAGASYDCKPLASRVDEQYRPPLAQQLFDARDSFATILARYPWAEAWAAENRPRIAGPVAIEQLLKQAQDEPNPILRRAAEEFPLYLQELLGEVSQHYVRTGGTHFHGLVRKITRAIPDFYTQVLFLTLNYDLFLDRALETVYAHPLTHLDRYVFSNQPWALVKLHGSVNWGRLIYGEFEQGETFVNVLRSVGELRFVSTDLTILDYHGDAGRFRKSRAYYPAVMVPVEGKSGFVCPDTDQDAAKAFIRACRSFLVVGCSLLDPDVAELLAGAETVEKLLVVNGNTQAAQEAVDRLGPRAKAFSPSSLERTLRNPGILYDGGFDQFVTSDALESFLKR